MSTLSNQSQQDQTIAMAAICQAAIMIQQCAKGHSPDRAALEMLFNGIMVTSPDSASDVYPDLPLLKPGSALLVHQLSGQATSKDVEVTRYLAGMLSISKKLLNNGPALSKLTEALSDVERRLVHFDITDDSVAANFATAYSEIISPMGQKIKIIGTPDVLKQPRNQNLVRALLLAGIRAAILWRQTGGKRRHFIFSRKVILQDAISFHKQLSTIS